MLVEHESVLLILKAVLGIKALDISEGEKADIGKTAALAIGKTEEGEDRSDCKLFKNCILLKIISFCTI